MTQQAAKPSLWKSYRFSLVLLASIVLGCAVGLIFGEKATILRPLGQIFLNLLFTVVVPLVFVTIASAVGNMLDMRRLGRILGWMLAVFLVTAAVAAVLILLAVKMFPPAQGVELALQASGNIETVSLGEAIVRALTVPDFSGLLSRSNMLPLIVFSVIFGFCVSTAGEAGNRVARLLGDLSVIMMKAVDLIMLYAPIGLGAYFATLIGEFGVGLLEAYGRALAVYIPVCILYFLTAFPVYAYIAGGMPAVRQFLRHIAPPAITSLATQSSIATLPVNLEAATQIGVPKDVRDIVLPIGATLHMEGSVLAAVLKIAFLFGIFGQDFGGLELYAACFLIAVMAGVVMSGVPGGGLIGEMLIVSLFNFPPEAFPIIATIGFLVDAPATCINVTGDTVAAMLVARRVEGKNWLKNARMARRETLESRTDQAGSAPS
ncbi:MAG: dicarboxylate/amino acid:cation symporter [Azoarcus sp.]|jgi:Na+/H+-dicarboxylate symporter|nr:dicarboxylate/amino acid:cation symporter [Azoarcus sp.]